MLHGTLSNGVSSSDFSVYFSALWDKNIEEQNTNAKQIKEGCRIAERTQIQVPGLNGRVEEPVKSQKTT